MPKGSVSRRLGWIGNVVSPSPKRKQANAKVKNLTRENFPTAAQYREDVKAARVKKEVRAEPGKGPMARVNENPVKALKRRLASKVK